MRSLDTYLRRQVISIIGEDGEFIVRLAGGAQIISTAMNIPMPNIPIFTEGDPLIFENIIMSSESTQMVLKSGNEEYRIALDPTNYTIYDLEHSAEPWRPQSNKSIHLMRHSKERFDSPFNEIEDDQEVEDGS